MLTRIFITIFLGITLTTTSITVSLAQDLESGPGAIPFCGRFMQPISGMHLI